ncbi:heavy metal-responsive transcriptional regulator [Demequina sediminicola]|uniref:heavy metal-responsive transcriptional regulator n=1 Tax=Demequina sediminicola TaxID=1095026 RepID=UPI000785E00D|nr:heavy metal-responsive transcriptional regulator [Demequina sediminicola]
MRIGELAERAGVTAKTVRYYESIGLLDDPGRTTSGYRDYDAEALERLVFVRDAQAAGLTLKESGHILDMKAAGHGTCQHTSALLDRHLADIESQIASLEAARAELTALRSRADVLDPASCTDPNRCQVVGEHGA